MDIILIQVLDALQKPWENNGIPAETRVQKNGMNFMI